MTTIAIQRTRNGLPNSAESATVRIMSQSGGYDSGIISVVPASTGMYSYATDSLVPGSYTVTWTFSNMGQPDDVITRVITLDAPTGRTDGITLEEIEQAVARTVGPYIRVKATAGSTVARLASTRLKSSAPLGSYEDQFMLRRGRTFDTGAWLSTFTKDDRVRLITTYDNATGFLNNDLQWTNAPDASAGEAVEIMYLEPEFELRPAVLEGLKRCFFWDTITITPDIGAINKFNMTAAASWITQTSQVRQVASSFSGSRYAPERTTWFKPFRSGKDVWMWTDGLMYGIYTIDVLRPVDTLLNNELSVTGPNDDLDVLYVDKDYAKWAGILKLWETVPERIMPLTHEGLRPDQKAAAAEFTKHSLMVANQGPADVPMIRYGQIDLTQIGNAPEPAI